MWTHKTRKEDTNTHTKCENLFWGWRVVLYALKGNLEFKWTSSSFCLQLRQPTGCWVPARKTTFPSTSATRHLCQVGGRRWRKRNARQRFILYFTSWTQNPKIFTMYLKASLRPTLQSSFLIGARRSQRSPTTPWLPHVLVRSRAPASSSSWSPSIFTRRACILEGGPTCSAHSRQQPLVKNSMFGGDYLSRSGAETRRRRNEWCRES